MGKMTGSSAGPCGPVSGAPPSKQLPGALHERQIGIFSEVAFGVAAIDQAARTLAAQSPTSPSDAPSVLEQSGASDR